MIGKILGNRYQVVEKIGDGGTAFVFMGLDNLLNRNVTIKVLRPEYVSDQDFVRRFRREAQAAASLSHPNIVSIYDVGYEEGIHYIVMEYIKGQSLKELIGEMGHLPVRMAADYACQIAHALQNAHRHGIIHRDVKPHNILISEEGRVKVADFGIAQAVTSSTVTYDGAILGSVHYFSPEHARGGQTGEKSDIYSLGVVLYEMLTGRVPYDGDSPVSVAVKHIQEPFPDPQEINTQLPSVISNIIRKAVEKEPEKRYQSAREISDELSAWLQGREIKPSELRSQKSQPAPPVEKPKVKKKLTPWHWAGIALLVLLLVGIIIGISQLRNIFVVPEVQVPDVVGENVARTMDILEEVGLKGRVTDQMPSDTIPSGHVLRQTPSAGRTVKKTREIELVLSTGPDLVEIEDVIGKTELEATLILRGKGFEVIAESDFSDQIPGTVIRQDPGQGFKLAKGSTVKLTVSKGGRPFRMKDLQGLSLDDARGWIELYGLLSPFTVEEHSNTIAAGYVIRQTPEAGEMVQAGDPVDLVISKGPNQAELQRHTININTSQIPLGETVFVTVTDVYGPREEEYINEGQAIVTFGWGSGEVTVRWLDQVEKKTFPR
ncbi:MAG: PASTA domain-containing protein [Clostridiales bacterium]|jgi:serine/threonine-protein kinase|nr:PASTA domain-containing protein [Clostridiales bacterium]